MGNNKYAVIDLGSNTFHILIAQKTEDGFAEIFRKRIFVGLAENGIEELSSTAMERGYEALAEFSAIMREYGVQSYRALGTAALRSANNRDEFLTYCKEKLDLDIEVIEGVREAHLIYKGVSLYPESSEGNHVIMDIGGGSVEYILIQNGKITWAKSFNIGVGVLYSNFHKNEPISVGEQEQLLKFLSNILEELHSKIKEIKIDSIIGASGSFEVLESLEGKSPSPQSMNTISIEHFKEISAPIILADFDERSKMKEIPQSRTKLIVVALLLIEYSILLVNPGQIRVSQFALKEGVLSEF